MSVKHVIQKFVTYQASHSIFVNYIYNMVDGIVCILSAD